VRFILKSEHVVRPAPADSRRHVGKPDGVGGY
jgi:hypothetical protein